MFYKKQIALGALMLLTAWLATPGLAWANTLSNSQEPGSVLVFPLFRTGTVPCPADNPYGCTPVTGTLPKTSFEISVVCPEGINKCADDDVDIHVEWVCGSYPIIGTCQQRDFYINTTVGGTVRFEPATELCKPVTPFDRDETLHACGNVVAPPCTEGYLIVWVVNEFNQPIKFDGLVGDAVLRESSTAVTAYNAIPIQAATSIPSRALIPLGSGGALKFDGTGYQEVTGAITGSVRLDFVNTAGADQDQTSLVLLTLDVISNRTNYATDVDLTFTNESEVPTSHAFSFVCFAETGSLFSGNLSFPAGNSSGFDLESSFSPETGKALVQSGPATQTNPFTGTTTPATLLGLVITREFDAAASVELRHFTYPLLNDSVPVATNFKP
jgi:hypothetical protein